jgi:hypothetical protein
MKFHPIHIPAKNIYLLRLAKDKLVREAIEIQLHPDNFNRDDGFNLSHTWCPIIKMLQLPNSAPMANQGQVQVENQPHPPGHRQGLYK